MATPAPTIAVEDKGEDLVQRTVCVKVCLGLLGNTRKVSNSQVEVDADKSLIRVSKSLIASQELQAIKSLDSDVRRYLYNTCLPFEAGIHLLPLELIESVDEKLREFEEKRRELVEVFIRAYPDLCRQAAERLRALYNPDDYPPVESVRSQFNFGWRYVSFGVPAKLREISARIFEDEREKAARLMAEASSEIQQVLRVAMGGLVEHLRERLADQPDGRPQRLRESTVLKLRDFLDTFDFRNVTDDGELKAQVEKARELLKGVTTDAMRNTAVLRAKIKDGMTEIAAQLDGLVKDRVGRKFRFDEE